MSCGNSVPRSQTNQSSSCCWAFWRSSPSRFWRVASCVSPPRPSCAKMYATVSKIIHEFTTMLSALFREKSKCAKIAPPSKGRCCTTAPSGEAPDCTSHEFCGLRKGFGLPTGLWKKGIPNIDRVQGPYSEMHWDSARSKNLNSPVLAFWWRQRRTLGC